MHLLTWREGCPWPERGQQSLSGQLGPQIHPIFHYFLFFFFFFTFDCSVAGLKEMFHTDRPNFHCSLPGQLLVTPKTILQEASCPWCLYHFSEVALCSFQNSQRSRKISVSWHLPSCKCLGLSHLPHEIVRALAAGCLSPGAKYFKKSALMIEEQKKCAQAWRKEHA